MDFQCDLYCYESADGYVTHVADQRRAYPVTSPTLPALLGELPPEELARQLLLQKLMGNEEINPLVPLGLAHDGKDFIDGGLGGFLDTLRMLKEAGYRFPDSLIPDVEEELAEFLAAEAEDDAHPEEDRPHREMLRLQAEMADPFDEPSPGPVVRTPRP